MRWQVSRIQKPAEYFTILAESIDRTTTGVAQMSSHDGNSLSGKRRNRNTIPTSSLATNHRSNGTISQI